MAGSCEGQAWPLQQRRTQRHLSGSGPWLAQSPVTSKMRALWLNSRPDSLCGLVVNGHRQQSPDHASHVPGSAARRCPVLMRHNLAGRPPRMSYLPSSKPIRTPDAGVSRVLQSRHEQGHLTTLNAHAAASASWVGMPPGHVSPSPSNDVEGTCLNSMLVVSSQYSSWQPPSSCGGHGRLRLIMQVT